ncbi:transposase [Calothrix brevissima NIES-22]|nr:transposase [Calothrix brevissima NIES-22]
MLLADTNREQGGGKDEAISQALNISVATIERVRQRLVEQGLEGALSRKLQNNRKPRCLDGSQEAHLIALTCSEPPMGQGHWTMRMLAQQMVELGYVEKISHETVRQTLKKTNSSRG